MSLGTLAEHGNTNLRHAGMDRRHPGLQGSPGNIHVNLDSSTPCWNDAIVGCAKLLSPPPRIFKGGREDTWASKTPRWSGRLYDLYLTRQSVDGSVDDSWMRGAIEFTQKTLGGAAKEVSPSQVFDFSFVQKAR